MRIFIIARGYPSAQYPQWGCFEKDQAEALADAGHEVVMLSFDGRFRLSGMTYGLSIKQYNRVLSVNLTLVPSKIPGLLGRKVRRTVEEWQLDYVYRTAVKRVGKPDILYSHYLFCSALAVSLKKKYGIPLVGIEHWSEVNKPVLSPRVKSLGNYTYPQLDSLVVVADSLRNAIMKHFSKPSTVVHNMAGPEFCYKEASHAALPVRYIATGSLIRRKAFDMLVRAFAQLQLPRDAWTLQIIGQGPEYESLKAEISENGLGDNIQLSGQMTKEQIADSLRASSVFVLPSRNENFSVAVLEALACGLPVIASICGGIRECIDERNGVLFPVDDVEALKQSIIHMQNHAADYDRRAIADDCQQRFGPQVIAKQLTEVFERVVAEAKQKEK